MKKIISLSIVLLLIASVAIAENPAVRYFQNGKGYVKVYYNRSKGVLSISSQVDMNAEFISELDITVTCVHTSIKRAVKERGSNITPPSQRIEEQYTVCNNTYVNIPINQTKTLSDGLNNPPQDTNTDYYTNFNVVIGGNNMLVEDKTNKDMPAYDQGSSSKNQTTTTPATPEKTSNNAAQEKPAAVPFPTASASQNTAPISSGGITCAVSGSTNQNIATITNPVVKSSSGKTVRVNLKLTKQAAEKVIVVVHLYDGNVVVGSGIAEITRYNSQGYVDIKDLEANHTYSARIVSATCQ